MPTFLTHNLTRLADFKGRDDLRRFWPWAGCVVALAFVGFGAMIGSSVAGAFAKMQAFVQAHPDQATVVSSPGSYSVSIEGNHPELMPDFGLMTTALGGMILVIVVLLAASVARRLHDRGRSGLWGLPPLLFLALGLFGMRTLMVSVTSGTDPDMRLFFGLFLNNIIYLATLVLLIFQLATPGRPEANRFGPPVG